MLKLNVYEVTGGILSHVKDTLRCADQELHYRNIIEHFIGENSIPVKVLPSFFMLVGS